MQRRRVVGLVLAGLALALTAGAAIPPIKQKVMQVKEANKTFQALEQKDAAGILAELARDYKGPQGAAPAPSSMERWFRSPRPHQLFYDQDKLVHTDLEHGVVAVEPLPGGKILAAPRAGESPRDLALRYVTENLRTYHLQAPGGELTLARQTTDKVGGTHLLFQQHYRGVPIWGRQMAAHLDKTGGLAATTGYLAPTPAGAGIKPSLPSWRAVEIAQARLAADGRPMTLTPEQFNFFHFDPPRPELYFWPSDPIAPPALCWMLELRPNVRDWFRFFVSATDGKILDYYNATNTVSSPATVSATNMKNQTVTLHTYKIGANYYLLDGSRPMFVAGQTDSGLLNEPKGAIQCLDLRGQAPNNTATIYYYMSATNAWPAKDSVSALDYGGKIYDYFKTVQNRNSFDNQGKTMMILMHVADANGQAMDNAYWNGSFVSLGDGKTITTAWANAFDLVAHEFTHAHVQYTANLEYKFQSGALNESFADLGGISLDNTNWKIGEDITKTSAFPTGTLRDMSNPHNGGTGTADLGRGWQPANMSEYVDLTDQQDHGGVHVNNGITNYAIYKMLSNPAIGHRPGENILFHALTNYLGKQSNFTDFRIAAVKSAGDLHGAGSAQQNAVKAAFDAVGIVDGSPTQPPPNTQPLAGNQYILAVATVRDGANNPIFPLAISDPFTSLIFMPPMHYLTATEANPNTGRPIAVDPYGQKIWFVDRAYKLRTIKPNGTAELIANATPQWSSVAVSPNGRLLALTRNARENRIWILDNNTQTFTGWYLTHPTTSQTNISADVAKYADSMIFLDDRYLVYDCFNSVKAASGAGTIDFWDVNIMDVTNGQILALLPPQGPGIQVMNPIFASNNKAILCVEVYDEVAQNDLLIGINLSTGVANLIANNGNSNAFADYSVDDKVIFFSKLNFYGTAYDLWGIDLKADKITPLFGPTGAIQMLQNAMMPLWFVQATPPAVSVGFSAVTSQASETQTTVNIPVTMTGGTSSQTVTVNYAVTGGNAIGNGVDYTLTGNTLTFSAGQTSKNISLTVVNDKKVKGNRTIKLTLSNPVNAWSGTKLDHTHTIVEDDQPSPASPEWQRYP